MTKKSTHDEAQENNPATATSDVAEPQETVPAEKSSTKSTPKASTKSALKPAAKSAPKAVIGAPSKALPKAAEKPAAKSVKSVKPKKDKLIRDSFTMPESEYSLLATMKKRCLTNGVAVKKSELLRAAIIGFADQSDAALTAAVQALNVIKTGRPAKG
ncbi:hypothetical protein [Propionivibrio sp.]|uniref:hypothetical protein n=1 Tax=Propionivibrio sp. TaxID=2212460 RepID=UPI003BEFE8F3